MNFNQHRPAGDIATHIDILMHYDSYVPDHSIQRVVPTGNTFIIFELDGYTRHTYNNDTLDINASYNNVWITGMHRNYLSISAHENSEMFVIQFNATGAYPFLGCDLADLNEKVVSAEGILGKEILALREMLLNASLLQEKFTAAENWLNNKYDTKKSPSEELLNVIAQLQQEPVANLNEIIERYPKTQKHLIDLFKKHVGLTPKYYQRILRFNEILQRIQNKEKIAWTDIAYSCGYSDQSHFIKEFKHFSGFNPKEFINQAHNKQPNFFPLDKDGNN